MTSQNSLDGYRHIVNLSTNVQETYQYDPHGGELLVALGAPQQTATDGSAETSKNYVGQNLCIVSSVVFYAGIVIASFVGGVLAGFAFMILRFSPILCFSPFENQEKRPRGEYGHFGPKADNADVPA